jgi:mono/diheme cytochrome c family protein
LKEQTIKRNLDAPVHMGRIWRIVPENESPSKIEKLSQKSSSELVEFLSHQDGWYRDLAQRLLVEKKDKSIVPELEELALNPSNEFGSFHALWTLEGMDQANEDFLFQLLNSTSELIQSSALRMLDEKAEVNPELKSKLGKYMIQLVANAGETLDLQLALSSYSVSNQDAKTILSILLKKRGNDALIRDAVMSSLANREFNFLRAIWQSDDWGDNQSDQEIILEMLTASIVKNANEKEIKDLLALVDQSEIGWKEHAILASLAIQSANSPEKGFVAFSSEPSIFQRTDLPLEPNRVEMLKSMFSWPGFNPTEATLASGTLDGESMKQFAEGRQKFLASCASCHGANGKGANRMGPPLVNSEWVLGDEKRLSLILLHGIEGPIEVDGKKYDAPEILPVMPAHSTMDDASIAAILTYIRNEWGNQASPVSRRTVGGMRVMTQGRVYPWSAAELNQHIENLEDSSPN